VNDYACQMLGYPREEFLRLSAYDIVEDGARERIPEIIAKIQQSGRVSFEITAVAKDGRRIPVEINASLLQLGGRRLGLAIARDVTERRRAAAALRESEERYRSLWESALDGIVLHELLTSPRQGHFIDANDCLCRVLGYTREEILALSLADITAPEAKEAMPELAAQVRRAGRMLFETILIAKDGRHIPVEVNSSVIQLGDRRAALAIVRDVTERKRAVAALQESEAYFRAFMNNSPAIAWTKDEQGRYVFLSGTYENRLGLRLEDCRGKTDFDLWPREVAEVFRKNDQEVLRTGRTVEVVEATPAPGGGPCYWWNFKFLLQDAAGRRFVGGIGVDITERRRLEEDLRRLNEGLEEQVRARTRELEQRAAQLQQLTLQLAQAEERERRRLAEFLHDDLQQILAAAKFQLGILGARLEDDALRQTAQYARQMLSEAITKSRNLSHELGPGALFRGDLREAFECLADQTESRHGLIVQVDIHGLVDSPSEPVRSFLYRAAQELLFNIAKYAQVREAKLRLQRVRDQLWLTISDRGQGFDVASLAQTEGSGLMGIRDRAELLGGHLKIKSTPGRGSIFFLVVPDVTAGHDNSS